MKSKLMYLFFAAWMLAGCSADTMLDDPRAGVIALVSMIVAVACAAAIGGDHEQGSD